MFVTLDVSKLNGWLNADAPCRVERRGVRYAGRSVGRGREGVGRRQRMSGMHGERARLLDVSKLSGWLNANASCRVERRAYDARRGADRGRERHGPAAAHERHARGEGLAVKAGGAIGHARSAR
eukprot:scaffold94562_cov58-Phaeocystis_antarctica.AAC.7